MRGGPGLGILVLAVVFILPASAAAAPACTSPGTPGNDVLRGTNGPDVICAGGGQDRVFGRGGADVIRGGAGADTLIGGPGADRLSGGAGRDTCQDSIDATHFASCEQKSGDGPRTRHRRLPRGLWNDTCCSALPAVPDTTAPEVLGVYFDSPYVDTSSELHNTISIETRDPQSGVKQVELEITGPDGPWRKIEFESPNPYGSAYTWVGVPLTTPAGKYRLASLSLADRAGNRVSFDTAELEATGLDAEFDVFHGPDTEGPKLTDFSLAPETLDTSAGPGSVHFSLTATDDLSGVDDAAALIRLPGSDPPHCFPCGHRGASDLESGSIYDGVWAEDLPLAQFARAGTYRIDYVVLFDRAGNESYYDHEELEGLGYPVDFTQTGAEDTEPPEVVDFWMTPGTVQSSHGNGAIQFFLHAKDDLSGIGETDDSVLEEMRVDFQPPHASEWWYTDGGTTQISGTDLDGVWRFEKILPHEAETGTWTIPWIAVTDRAGNATLLSGSDLKSRGWDSSFENLP